MEGGITCDGLKQKTTGVKYYDFVAHYLEFGPVNLLNGQRQVSMVCKVLLLENHVGAESASALRDMLEASLSRQCGLEFDKLMEQFTLVTDCDATLPCIVGAYASSARVPFNERWAGCISHQLNTVMKHAMDEEDREKSAISDDLRAVKTIFRVFKHGSWNSLLPRGLHLIQEVETRFGTTHTVVNRFLKVVDKAAVIIGMKDSGAALDALCGLMTLTTPNGKTAYPALEAVDAVFAPTLHAQIALETSDSPTMHLIFPMLENNKDTLQSLSDGVADFSDFETPHLLTRSFSAQVLMHLERVEVHDLWIAGVCSNTPLPGTPYYRWHYL